LFYEAFNPKVGKLIEGFFLAGWSLKAGSSMVGISRKDGENAAIAMLQYLHTLPTVAYESEFFNKLEVALIKSGKEIVLAVV
jgi:hypothetical protein